MGDSGKKKFIFAGLASILLVAAVAAVFISTKKGADENGTLDATSKAVQAVCAPTDYKDTCEQSLANANTTDPKELIKAAFDAAAKNIGDVLKNSALLKEAATDSSTKDVYSVCQDVLETAVEDLKRSLDTVGQHNVEEDLKTWLSAVITNQETCLDAFENTTGDAGEKMKNLMRTARELSSNGLAMVSDISSLMSSLGSGSSSRRLLSDPEINRRILAAASRGPNVVVAQDGSGKFRTVMEAVASIPKKNNSPFVIYVKAGVYKENVEFPKGSNQVILVGDGPLKTIITGNKCFAKGVKTFYSATVAVNGEDFLARDIAIENTAGPDGHQAVALRVSGDRAVFFNVNLNGFQDTLYAHNYRQYYRDCWISGTIDFIFGDSLALFQNCKFNVRLPGPNQACMVTAQGRVDQRSIGATVIQNGEFIADAALLKANPPVKAYLGRPWKELSRTIIMQSNIGGFISPEGWAPWAGNFALDTLYYGEYSNRGPGAKTDHRVKWKGLKKMTPQMAESWTGGKAFNGDMWVKNSGVPYVPTMMQVS